jgi:hypothetical protein
MAHLFNFVAFQIGWFACILSAANHWPWAAVFASLAVVVVHLYRARDPRAEGKLILAAGLIGAVWENALALGGLTGFHDGVLLNGTAPLWMVAQWMMFATTLNQSLAWLKPRLRLAAALAAVGSPLSYLAGERFGAIVLLERDAALIALAAGWAVLAPLLLHLARRWNGCLDAHPAIPVGARHA